MKRIVMQLMRSIMTVIVVGTMAVMNVYAGTMAKIKNIEGHVLKNGQEFSSNDLPEKMSAQLKRGGSVRFLMEENGTTGYQWEAIYSKNECEVEIEHRGSVADVAGAPGKAAVKITKNAAVQSPSLVEFRYRRSWEKDVKPLKTVRVVLYTIPGEDIWTPKCLKLEQ